MSLLTAIVLMGYCLLIGALLASLLAVPMAVMGMRPPMRTLALGTCWTGSLLLLVLAVARWTEGA